MKRSFIGGIMPIKKKQKYDHIDNMDIEILNQYNDKSVSHYDTTNYPLINNEQKEINSLKEEIITLKNKLVVMEEKINACCEYFLQNTIQFDTSKWMDSYIG